MKALERRGIVEIKWNTGKGAARISKLIKPHYEELATRKEANVLKIGDKVVMNDNYCVAERNEGKIFVVRSRPFNLCGTECAMLEDYSGGYAADGLTLYEPVGHVSK